MKHFPKEICTSFQLIEKTPFSLAYQANAEMGFVVAVIRTFERGERGKVLILGSVSATVVFNNVTYDVY